MHLICPQLPCDVVCVNTAEGHLPVKTDAQFLYQGMEHKYRICFNVFTVHPAPATSKTFQYKLQQKLAQKSSSHLEAKKICPLKHKPSSVLEGISRQASQFPIVTVFSTKLHRLNQNKSQKISVTSQTWLCPSIIIILGLMCTMAMVVESLGSGG